MALARLKAVAGVTIPDMALCNWDVMQPVSEKTASGNPMF